MQPSPPRAHSALAPRWNGGAPLLELGVGCARAAADLTTIFTVLATTISIRAVSSRGGKKAVEMRHMTTANSSVRFTSVLLTRHSAEFLLKPARWST